MIHTRVDSNALCVNKNDVNWLKKIINKTFKCGKNKAIDNIHYVSFENVGRGKFNFDNIFSFFVFNITDNNLIIYFHLCLGLSDDIIE